MGDPVRVRRVAARVLRRIGEVTPRGLGAHGWDFSRKYVEPYENAWLDSLNAWAWEDTLESREELRRAAELYVGAWKRAGWEWDAAGRPGAENRQGISA